MKVSRAKVHLSARVKPATLRRLERRASRLGRPRSALVERYLEEGLRLDQHPGIVFVDGALGRRAALATRRGLDVWQVISTLQDNKGNVEDTAEVLDLPVIEVRIALAYYADEKAEIDAIIRENDEMAQAEEAAWRRQQAALS